MAREAASAAALLLASMAIAAPSASAAPRDTLEAAASLKSLGAADLRVATVAYRLARSGTPVCPRTAPLTGVTLHDLSQYAPRLRDAARAAFGLSDGIGVLAVAPGSPADMAGIRAGDTLIAIGEGSLAGSSAAGSAGAKATYDAVAGANAVLESAAAAGPFAIRVRRGGIERAMGIAPVLGCASRVQLRPDRRVYAGAGGLLLTVTTGLLDYVANDDELALVIAHEMAHNALGHPEALAGRRGRRRAAEAGIRETEAAADRLAYVLMARAGYDVGVAEGFWRRLYSGPAKGRANAATHRDLDSRIADAREALAGLAPVQ